jgi:hypothetical protein
MCCVLFACRKEPCEVRDYLFPHPDTSALVLHFNDLDSNADILMKVICENPNQVYLQADHIFLPFSYYAWGYECDPGFLCILPLHGRDRLDVLINEREQLLVESEVVGFEALDSMFKTAYLNPERDRQYLEDPSRSIIQVKWDVNTDTVFVSEVLDKLVASYTEIIEDKLGELDCSQTHVMDSLTEIYPFHLSLPIPHRLYQKMVVPPPPPLPE